MGKYGIPIFATVARIIPANLFIAVTTMLK